MAVKVRIIEPDITEEENERRWQAVQEVLKKIAKDMQRKGKTIVTE